MIFKNTGRCICPVIKTNACTLNENEVSCQEVNLFQFEAHKPCVSVRWIKSFDSNFVCYEQLISAFLICWAVNTSGRDWASEFLDFPTKSPENFPSSHTHTNTHSHTHSLSYAHTQAHTMICLPNFYCFHNIWIVQWPWCYTAVQLTRKCLSCFQGIAVKILSVLTQHWTVAVLCTKPCSLALLFQIEVKRDLWSEVVRL